MAYVHPAILVIDDDAAERQRLSSWFRAEGYAVETAGHGREALDRLRTGFQPCVILMDLMMPEMDGFDFRREQQADPHLAFVPLIVYSAVPNLALYAKQLRVNAFIHKPGELTAVTALVREHCLK